MPQSSQILLPGQGLTSSKIVQASREPAYEVFVGENGDAAVRVTGVPEPFNFVLPLALLQEHAAFGRPTRESTMRLAQQIAREKIFQMASRRN